VTTRGEKGRREEKKSRREEKKSRREEKKKKVVTPVGTDSPDGTNKMAGRLICCGSCSGNQISSLPLPCIFPPETTGLR